VQEGWGEVKSSLAAYEDAYSSNGDYVWNPFSDDLATAAVGAEVELPGGKVTLRAGYSQELGANIDDAIVPDNSIGLGGSFLFDAYRADIGLVRESFLEGGESGQVTNYGIYLSAGYEF
jgi:hypothetical protein